MNRLVFSVAAIALVGCKHSLTGERATYRRCFEIQVREMARAMQNDEIYRPFTVR